MRTGRRGVSHRVTVMTAEILRQVVNGEKSGIAYLRSLQAADDVECCV